MATFLYVQHYAGDPGGGSAAPGGVFWESPAIQSPDGVGGSIETLIARQLYPVRVKVWNSGSERADNVQVEAYLGDPATGFTHASAQPLDWANRTQQQQWPLISIDADSFQTVDFSFTPAAAGHMCYLARTSCPGDSYGSLDNFAASSDRHVAQHNIDIIVVQKRATLPSGFALGLANTTGVPTDARVQIEAVRDPAFLSLYTQRLAQQHPEITFTAAPGGLVPPRIMLGDDRVHLPAGSVGPRFHEIQPLPTLAHEAPGLAPINPQREDLDPAHLQRDPARLQRDPARLQRDPARLQPDPARLPMIGRLEPHYVRDLDPRRFGATLSTTLDARELRQAVVRFPHDLGLDAGQVVAYRVRHVDSHGATVGGVTLVLVSL